MRSTLTGLYLFTAIALATSPAWSQANWEGPTGAFLSPLAFVRPARSSQVSAHYVDLQPVGSLSSWGYTYGGGTWEAGVTRTNLSLGGSADFDLFHAKWIALPSTGEAPQVALGAIARNSHAGAGTTDVYAVATKVFPAKIPVIASLTVRNTNGLGSGLFGKNTERTTELGGFLGVQATPNFTIGVEYWEQPRVRPWRDICSRWVVTPTTFVELGVANINDTFDNQVCLAFTHQW